LLILIFEKLQFFYILSIPFFSICIFFGQNVWRWRIFWRPIRMEAAPIKDSLCKKNNKKRDIFLNHFNKKNIKTKKENKKD